ncbi:RNA-binding S4 domain-containing protein [Hirschia baltica]|uniref:RNA-binding S4 domain protein n=1 Tax=Hirschia baltica (strain ATCC 49814 / DSM 5838 / IFAM 1418) TaxID=582402 RepID=C6XPI0_HIRBI|nr:RNA-binding S4 domain-containing protein [Hirschia baltica]ACT58466.1 RNA-binding S4 domain protein [Hirschia baltica ATCC 49814]
MAKQDASPDETDRMRVDLFLHRIRFFKTRALATSQITKKNVRISRNGETRRTNKPAANIFVGDIVSFYCNKEIVTLSVLNLPLRRGPAPEAQKCYTLIEDQLKERD